MYKQKPWLYENLNLNAFHNKIKKFNKKVRVSTELLHTDKLSLLIKRDTSVVNICSQLHKAHTDVRGLVEYC